MCRKLLDGGFRNYVQVSALATSYDNESATQASRMESKSNTGATSRSYKRVTVTKETEALSGHNSLKISKDSSFPVQTRDA